MTESQASGSSVLSTPITEGVIKLRLDTQQIKTDMEMYLRGKQLVPFLNEETGETLLKVETIGEPLMNDKGIQCMLMLLSNTINAHGVQGNWKSDYFEQFIAEVDENISCDLWTNMMQWGVSIENFNVICNTFMNLVQQYASRIIDNKERDKP
jgi:hypothetical protein